MTYQGLKSRLKRLERSLHDEFQTVIALEDGTELSMDIRELFDLVVRWNTLPFKEQTERSLTDNDVIWLNHLSKAVLNREEAAYGLVIGAKKAASDLLKDLNS